MKRIKTLIGCAACALTLTTTALAGSYCWAEAWCPDGSYVWAEVYCPECCGEAWYSGPLGCYAYAWCEPCY